VNPSKYGNRKVEIDGHTFDSAKEARRYGELKLLERGGYIDSLMMQVRYPLKVAEKLVCTYVADFVYLDHATGLKVVEDVKSDFTRKLPVYRIKAKLFAALHGFPIREV